MRRGDAIGTYQRRALLQRRVAGAAGGGLGAVQREISSRVDSEHMSGHPRLLRDIGNEGRVICRPVAKTVIHGRYFDRPESEFAHRTEKCDGIESATACDEYPRAAWQTRRLRGTRQRCQRLDGHSCHSERRANSARRGSPDKT